MYMNSRHLCWGWPVLAASCSSNPTECFGVEVIVVNVFVGTNQRTKLFWPSLFVTVELDATKYANGLPYSLCILFVLFCSQSPVTMPSSVPPFLRSLS